MEILHIIKKLKSLVQILFSLKTNHKSFKKIKAIKNQRHLISRNFYNSYVLRVFALNSYSNLLKPCNIIKAKFNLQELLLLNKSNQWLCQLFNGKFSMNMIVNWNAVSNATVAKLVIPRLVLFLTILINDIDLSKVNCSNLLILRNAILNRF